MKLLRLGDLLKTIGPPVFHYSPGDEDERENLDQYIVWAEDGEGGSIHADDSKTEQSIQGTIDYFTRDEFDPIFNLIQEKLNSADDIAWRLNSIQYEEDTGYIHYEWVWEMV